MIIRYRGGPLNRRTFTGPSRQPKYRDHTGQPIPFEQGSSLSLAAARQAAATATYVYNPQQCAYESIDLLIAHMHNRETQ